MDFYVYLQMSGLLVRVATLTAGAAEDALRIARQKGYPAPVVEVKQ